MPVPGPEVRCITCPAWQRITEDRGECHGATPDVMVLPRPPQARSIVPAKEALGQEQPDLMVRDFLVNSIFPPMPPGGWCARHPAFDWSGPGEAVFSHVIPGGAAVNRQN